MGDGFFVFIVPGTPDHLLTDQEHPDSDTEGDSQDEVDIVGSENVMELPVSIDPEKAGNYIEHTHKNQCETDLAGGVIDGNIGVMKDAVTDIYEKADTEQDGGFRKRGRPAKIKQILGAAVQP